MILRTQSKINGLVSKCECSIGKKLASDFILTIDKLISDKQQKLNVQMVRSSIDQLSKDGKLNHIGLWKLKRKFCPRQQDPPMIKRDENGSLISTPQSLKILYLTTYKKRLSRREMSPVFKHIFDLKTSLWTSRLTNIEKIQSKEWTHSDLEKVLSSLKNNKSRDANGMVNELFKSECLGSDLRVALVHFFNGIKKNQSIPKYMTLSNVTSIFKNKGSRDNLENDRGVFIQTVLKKILEKLIYIGNYEAINQNMSDSNIGARKERSMRDHLFVLYATINSVIKGKLESIDIQIYDIEKCFDSLWLEECFNDIFDTLPDENLNDQISLLYKTNETNLVSVKTPVGLTDRVDLPYIVQQGGTWGSLLCANSIDTLGKQCRDTGNFNYLFREKTSIPPLGFIDDLTGIAKCGTDSLELNVFLTTKIELKNLVFGKNKCARMHVGKQRCECKSLKVHGYEMQDVSEFTYLGDLVSADGRNNKNIKDRSNKGIGLISKIFNILHSVSFGTHSIDIALVLRNSILLNGILTNSETWHNVSKTDIEEIERVDKLFFLKLFEVPSSTPAVSFYLETGSVPISVVIKVRRLMYFHSILRHTKNDLVKRVFKIQWNSPLQGDWVHLVKTDLFDFDLPCDLIWVSSITKGAFKRIVKKKAETFTLRTLLCKKERYSKLSDLTYYELSMQKYLMNEDISFNEKKIIFKFRSKMADFGNNFKGGRKFTVCPLCKLHYDDQSLCLQCPKIREELGSNEEISDLFRSNVSKRTAKILQKVTSIRKNN